MDKLHQPAEMDFSISGNIAERWKSWKQTVQLYLDVAMSEKTEKEKCKAFLYVIGKEGRENIQHVCFRRRTEGQMRTSVRKV